jgi:GT2 family glycosyltransferase
MNSVLIGCPVRDRAWILPHYLAHLYRLEYPKELSTLCFVLNDSTDGTQAILEDFARAHEHEYRRIKLVLFNQGAEKDVRQADIRRRVFLTLAKARNRFLEELGDEDYLFSVDSDVLVPPSALTELLACDKDIVAARIWNDPRKTIPNFLYRGPWYYRHYSAFPCPALFEVAITGAVYLLKRAVVEKVRYGDHLQGEDVYFCEDAQRHGFKLWVHTGVYCEHVMSPETAAELPPGPEELPCSTS